MSACGRWSPLSRGQKVRLVDQAQLAVQAPLAVGLTHHFVVRYVGHLHLDPFRIRVFASRKNQRIFQ